MTDAPGASSDDTLRSTVAALLPEFRARAAESEQLRTMPADLVRQAKAGGLFRLNLPRSLGGLELDPAATAEIFEEISRADGSAGWTIVIGNSTAFFAWLDPAVAKELSVCKRITFTFNPRPVMLMVWRCPWMPRSRWRPSSPRCSRTWTSGSGGW